MALKLLYYFVFVFVAMMVFLLIQKPYTIVFNQESQNEASVQMQNATNYSMSKEGINSVARAASVWRYADFDKFVHIDIKRVNEKGKKETLVANNAILQKDLLSLSGNVLYQNEDGLIFRAPVSTYDLNTRVLRADVDFVLEDKQSKSRGNSLVYETKDGKIFAKKIKSIIKVEK